jgi:hypothetical protein
MPYYIYRVTERPIRQLAKLGELPSFREASAEAKRLRAEGAEADGVIKMIFAENELQAEDLLSQVRPAPLVVGDDL